MFVSDDRKDDWAIQFKGHDLGPRKELIKEFIQNTDNLFYSVTTNGFIRLISEKYSVTGTEKLEKETKIIRKDIAHKQQEIYNRTSQELLDSLHKQKDLVDRNLTDPFETINKQNELLNNRWQDPFEAINKRNELLNRSLKDPFEYLNERNTLQNHSENSPIENQDEPVREKKSNKSKNENNNTGNSQTPKEN